MFIPEKLKLNKFKLVSIPRTREYFSRYGFASTPASEYTGDELSPMRENKIDDIENYRVYAEMKQRELESQDTNS